MSKQVSKNYTPETILSLLQNHGSIRVNYDDSGMETRIITGIFGDGTPEGTNLQIIDPTAGCSYKETFSQFVEKLPTVNSQQLLK
jgi:Papain-like cysteine protease AvrRpt2